ncbi:hypothetical protein [Terrabacter sp. BE26]|uniref:hypothetical protein n=1 Tax=Terrabacter sp. BE26 TaxID=2898152 RepID=UPI0035BE8A88
MKRLGGLSPSAPPLSTSTVDAAAQQAARDAAAAQAAAQAKAASDARAAAAKAAAAKARAAAAARARAAAAKAQAAHQAQAAAQAQAQAAAQAEAAAQAQAQAAAQAEAAAQAQAAQDAATAAADSFDKEYAKEIAGRILEDVATGDERFLDQPELGASTTMNFLSTDMDNLLGCGIPTVKDQAHYSALVTTLRDFYAKASDQLPDDVTGAAATYTIARQHTSELLTLLNPALGTRHRLPAWSYM